MKRPPLFALTVTLILTLAGAAFATDVYKWEDAEGGVHYSDRPPDEAAVQLSVKTPSAQSASGTAQEDARRAEQARREKNCAAAKARLETYEKAQILFEVDRNNERRTLSEEERNQVLDSARKERDAWCG